MRYYELHITILGERLKIRKAVEGIGWKFSAIDGDPVEGDGVKCYATKHLNHRVGKKRALNVLFDAAKKLEEVSIVTVTRRKIEDVIFDDRSSKVCFTENCAQCQELIS